MVGVFRQRWIPLAGEIQSYFSVQREGQVAQLQEAHFPPSDPLHVGSSRGRGLSASHAICTAGLAPPAIKDWGEGLPGPWGCGAILGL